jgi:hypothetical protein
LFGAASSVGTLSDDDIGFMQAGVRFGRGIGALAAAAMQRLHIINLSSKSVLRFVMQNGIFRSR